MAETAIILGRLCRSVLIVGACLVPACKKADSAASSLPVESGLDREARSVAADAINERWAKAPDGYTSALATGLASAPDHYLRQFRGLVVHGAEPADLTDSDKLNGVEWAGKVYLEPSPCREAGDPGIVLDGLSTPVVFRQRGRWTQWVDFQPTPLRLQKVRGKWQVNSDTLLLRGHVPTEQDYTRAGVR